MLLAGVGVSFAAVPIVELVYATLGFAFAEIVVLRAFDVLTVVRAVVGGGPRGSLPGGVVFAKLDHATTILVLLRLPPSELSSLPDTSRVFA